MTLDVAVIGGGLIGIYTAWRLATAGAEVVVVERGIAGDGSTGRSAGGLRQQFASPYEISLSRLSRRFYDRLENDPDFPGGIDRCGYVFLADDAQQALLQKAFETQREHGVDVEWLEPDALRDALPYCELDGVSAGTRSSGDGFVDPWTVHQWLMRAARAAGVTVHQHTPVHDIHRDGTTWRVNGLRVRTVVIAAGAWTGDLGLDLPVSASPRVKVLTDAHPALPNGMPLVTDLGTGAYVRSDRGHALVGAKPIVAPRGFKFDTSPEHLAAIIQRAAVRFPSLERAGIMRAVCGLYEVTPDRLPLAGPVGGNPGLWVIAGFNGHGIMHGPAVADAVCATITAATAQIDLGPLQPDRFAQDRPQTPTVSLL